MHVGDITIENEQGEVLDSIGFHLSAMLRIVHEGMTEDELSKTYCLQFIGDYCDTTFNTYQSKLLAAELVNLRDRESSQNAEYLTSVIQLITKYQDEFHTYVKFHGD